MAVFWRRIRQKQTSWSFSGIGDDSTLFYQRLARGLCFFMRAGCKFSRVQTRLTLAIVEAKSASHVWGRQKKTRHAEVAWRRKCP